MRTSITVAMVALFTLGGAAPPVSAAGIGSVHVTVCGTTGSGYIACVTGTAINTNTWHLWVGGTYCWSTGCDDYTALDTSIPPLQLGFAYYVEIPGNSFNVCAELTDNGSTVASDCY